MLMRAVVFRILFRWLFVIELKGSRSTYRIILENSKQGTSMWDRSQHWLWNRSVKKSQQISNWYNPQIHPTRLIPRQQSITPFAPEGDRLLQSGTIKLPPLTKKTPIWFLFSSMGHAYLRKAQEQSMFGVSLTFKRTSLFSFHKGQGLPTAFGFRMSWRRRWLNLQLTRNKLNPRQENLLENLTIFRKS